MHRNEISLGVIHCTATTPNTVVSAATIDAWHKKRGWSGGIGYHWLVKRSGVVTPGRSVLFDFAREGELWVVQGAHVRGYNHGSIGIALEGGLDDKGKSVNVSDPLELFTPIQMEALVDVIAYCERLFPELRRWCGHRDLSPDINKDGTVQPNEWLKTCPGFDVATWMETAFE